MPKHVDGGGVEICVHIQDQPIVRWDLIIGQSRVEPAAEEFDPWIAEDWDVPPHRKLPFFPNPSGFWHPLKAVESMQDSIWISKVFRPEFKTLPGSHPKFHIQDMSL